MIALSTSGRAGRVRASDVRRALCGHGDRALVVQQQAYRLTADHSDEVVLMACGSEFWVGARLHDRTIVWGCHDRFSAEDKFDELTGADDGWKRAEPRPTAA